VSLANGFLCSNVVYHHLTNLDCCRICWFAIPFSLATSLGLTSTALQLPITAAEAGAGLVPPAVATELLGQAGSVLILIMLFMAIVSTGSAESIAVSSLVAYDIYRQYINPEATGDQILLVSRIVVVCFGLIMGALSILLFEIGLNLGWVYLFMGIVIGSAVVPLWNMMTWSKASGTGAIIAAWSGFILAVTGWLIAAKIQSGSVSVANLGTNEVMLSGNLIAICSSGIIHYIYSAFIDPQDFDFDTLDEKITLVEEDLRGLTDEEKDPVSLRRAERWITRRGYVLTFILIIVWPLLSVPAGVFTKSYFAFWVLVAIAWGFGAALVITILPLAESADDINMVLSGIFASVTGTEMSRAEPPADLAAQEEAEAAAEKEMDDGLAKPEVEEPVKEVDAVAAETPLEEEEA
jgi:Na+/proline symporter